MKTRTTEIEPYSTLHRQYEPIYLALLVGIGLLLVGLICRVAAAQEPEEPNNEVQGVLLMVQESEITVSVEGFSKTYKVAKNAEITRNGEPVSLADLQMRDRLSLHIESNRDGEVATKITALAPQ